MVRNLLDDRYARGFAQKKLSQFFKTIWFNMNDTLKRFSAKYQRGKSTSAKTYMYFKAFSDVQYAAQIWAQHWIGGEQMDGDVWENFVDNGCCPFPICPCSYSLVIQVSANINNRLILLVFVVDKVYYFVFLGVKREGLLLLVVSGLEDWSDKQEPFRFCINVQWVERPWRCIRIKKWAIWYKVDTGM